jgi:hypothetical protein
MPIDRASAPSRTAPLGFLPASPLSAPVTRLPLDLTRTPQVTWCVIFRKEVHHADS